MEAAQIKASLLVWFEAIVVQRARLIEALANDDAWRRARFDSIFLLEAFSVCLRWLDRAVEANLVTADAIKEIELDRRSIVDLRNMNIHQDEYVRGRGNQQSRFKTTDPFEHHADSLQVVSGQIVLGGRLDVLACAARFENVSQTLAKLGVLPPR